MSIFLQSPISLDIAAVRIGLAWAQSWSQGPILCRIGDGTMRLMVVDKARFVGCWSWPMQDQNQQIQFFLIPPFVARTLSGPAAWDASELEVVVKRNVVGLVLRERMQEFRLQWRWSAHDFQAPPEFKIMGELPDTMIHTPYVQVADIIHLALANLVQPTLTDVLLPDEGGILVDFTMGQINIDGELVTHSQQTRYYFDPKLVVRGLEIVRGKRIGFAVHEIRPQDAAILYLSNQRDNWDIHCAVLSVAASTAPTEQTVRIRETRAPMTDGAWDLKRR